MYRPPPDDALLPITRSTSSTDIPLRIVALICSSKVARFAHPGSWNRRSRSAVVRNWIMLSCVIGHPSAASRSS